MSFFLNKRSSKNVANERLKLILIHDRGDLSPILLESIKSEIIGVISKYVDIDNSKMEVNLTKTSIGEGNSTILVANIPIKKV